MSDFGSEEEEEQGPYLGVSFGFRTINGTTTIYYYQHHRNNNNQ